MPELSAAPKKLPMEPRRSLHEWGHFVHLLARNYMDYQDAIHDAAARHKDRAIDIDVQVSKDGTPWGLHWGDLGKNKLHDPKKQFGPGTRIAQLTDEQLERMLSPTGKSPHRIHRLLEVAAWGKVRVELELKTKVDRSELKKLFDNEVFQAQIQDGLIQVKTLAALPGAIHRLRPAHEVGFTTILSFTNYHGSGISKEQAWPVTDYTRGRPKWS